MSFEEKFPSLKGKVTSTDIVDEAVGSPRSSCLLIQDVMECCNDNQQIKRIIEDVIMIETPLKDYSIKEQKEKLFERLGI